MSNWMQFIGRPPKSIVNYCSGGGVQLQISGPPNIKAYSSGALTADTYKELISVTGGGVVQCAMCRTMDTTSRTVGLKIVIDGVTVFDAVSSAITASNKGLIAIGGGGPESTYSVPLHAEPQPFFSSLSISIKSSVSETDKVELLCNYTTN